MGYKSAILADSDYWAPTGHRKLRLVTFEITAPRFILAEINTHRMLSRNSASSRAIPVAKSIKSVRDDPFVPEAFGRNQPGMQAFEMLGDSENARAIWLDAAREARSYAADLNDIGVHKAWANRILEPFKWQTIIVTATDWSNFFALRINKEAQPEFNEIASMMKEQFDAGDPVEFGGPGVEYAGMRRWHLPLVDPDEFPAGGGGIGQHYWKKVSVGRCARVSYLTHDGKRDPDADYDLCERLRTSGHLSPFEHVARPFNLGEWTIINELHAMMKERDYDTQPFGQYLARHIEYSANFLGWHSYRADIPGQHDFTLMKGSQ